MAVFFRRNVLIIGDSAFFIFHFSFFIIIGPGWRIDSVDLIDGPFPKKLKNGQVGHTRKMKKTNILHKSIILQVI